MYGIERVKCVESRRVEGAEKGWSALSGRFGGCFVGLVARKASCLIPRADLPSLPIDHLTPLCIYL